MNQNKAKNKILYSDRSINSSKRDNIIFLNFNRIIRKSNIKIWGGGEFKSLYNCIEGE